MAVEDRLRKRHRKRPLPSQRHSNSLLVRQQSSRTLTLYHMFVFALYVYPSLFTRPVFSSVFVKMTVSQTFFSKPPGGLYTLPYLMEGSQNDTGTLSRAEWWEVLFFIKKLEPKQQQEINNILRQSLDEPVLTPSSTLLFTQGRIG